MKRKNLLDATGASIIEIILGVGMIGASFVMFTKQANQQFKLAETSKRRYNSSLVLNNVVNTISSMNASEMLDLISEEENVNGNVLGTVYTDEFQDWLTTWQDYSARPTTITYRIQVFDYDQTTELTLADLNNDPEYLKEYHKKITATLEYQESQSIVKTLTEQRWIIGQ